MSTDSSVIQREKYPHVKFWHCRDWEDYIKQHPHSRASNFRAPSESSNVPMKSRADPSDTLMYITDEAGTPIDQYQACDMQQTAREIFYTLADKGCPPHTWGSASTGAVDFYKVNMYKRHPNLRLCADEWKVKYFATTEYPNWMCQYQAKQQSTNMKREPDPTPENEALTCTLRAATPFGEIEHSHKKQRLTARFYSLFFNQSHVSHNDGSLRALVEPAMSTISITNSVQSMSSFSTTSHLNNKSHMPAHDRPNTSHLLPINSRAALVLCYAQ